MSDAGTPSGGLFGRIAVERGFLTQAQLASALRQQAQIGTNSPLGSLLIHRGLLTPEQVTEILKLQKQYEASGASSRPPPASPPSSLAAAAEAAAAALSPAPARTPPPAPAPAARTPAPATPPRPAVTAGAGPLGASRITLLLEAAEKRGASDVHLHAGAPAALRVEGRLGLVNQPAADPKEQERELLALMDDTQRKQFEEAGELDLSFTTAGGVRARANVYRTHVGVDATFRLVRRRPQSLEELQLPAALARLVSHHQGLVLVTGPAGSGKSTTLAALVHLLNEERAEHVLCFEDPIEIVHPQRRALVNQRQVGRDTESFHRALRGALREDPDVIVIGDLRDRDTISLAITAAETGHLVIGSMNTNSAGRTVGRLIDAFPPAQQGQVRSMLSESLRGVVTQRLVPGVDGKRVPALELLIVTPAIGNLIREGKLFQIRSQMQTGKALGMRTMDESLRELVLAGKVAPDEARRLAENPAVIPGTPQAAPAPAPAAPAAPARAPIHLPPTGRPPGSRS